MAGEGELGTEMNYMMEIRNNTHQLQQLVVTVKENNSFLFAGDQKSAFTLRPKSVHQLRFSFLPVQTGHQQLPIMSIFAKRYNGEIKHPNREKTVFIRPPACVSAEPKLD